MIHQDTLIQALLRLTGFFNRPQADVVLLRRAGSSLDRALFPLLIRASLEEQLTVSQLADTVGRHYSTVSRQITALQEQGFVKRTPDPCDNRQSFITVTAKGRAEAARIANARKVALAAVFTDWSAIDQANLARLVSKLTSSLETSLTDYNKGISQ
jgi:DNA-binding MarR family transcriptional regulator